MKPPVDQVRIAICYACYTQKLEELYASHPPEWLRRDAAGDLVVNWNSDSEDAIAAVQKSCVRLCLAVKERMICSTHLHAMAAALARDEVNRLPDLPASPVHPEINPDEEVD